MNQSGPTREYPSMEMTASASGEQVALLRRVADGDGDPSPTPPDILRSAKP